MMQLQKKDIANLINATLVTLFGASTKAFDSNVYTPKGLPGRNKNDVLTAINDPIINTVQATQAAIEKPSIFSISNALEDINDATNNIESIKEVDTVPELEIQFNNPKTKLELITRRETYYKLEPVDSGSLDNSKKLKVVAEKSLYIDDYSINRDTNHLCFNIGERVFYAYLDHIRIIDNEVQLVF